MQLVSSFWLPSCQVPRIFAFAESPQVPSVRPQLCFPHPPSGSTLTTNFLCPTPSPGPGPSKRDVVRRMRRSARLLADHSRRLPWSSILALLSSEPNQGVPAQRHLRRCYWSWVRWESLARALYWVLADAVVGLCQTLCQSPAGVCGVVLRCSPDWTRLSLFTIRSFSQGSAKPWTLLLPPCQRRRKQRGVWGTKYRVQRMKTEEY